MTLLSVTNLHVGFGPHPRANEVVKGVSFELAAGKTLAIVGESGSGKSVTALSINRLVDFGGGRITAGSIVLERDGAPFDVTTADERALTGVRGRDIGMIFQEPMTSLNPVHTIGAQIEEAFRLNRGLHGRDATDAARQALERVRIPDAGARLRYYPHQLSGGMRQRVMIAMALASSPRLLIADEPTTALDVTVQAQIMGLLAELRDEIGMAMIFITHDIGLVAGIADDILVMQAGVAVEQGPIDRVLDAPRHDYTRHLLKAVPHFEFGRAVRRDLDRPSDAKPVVAVRDLVIRFPARRQRLFESPGAVHAVEGVDFDLRPGETLAIVGESGSGKSTTARAILGLVRATRGRIDIEAGRSRRPLQMVFQDPFASLNPRLSVEQLLAEPAIANGRRLDAALRERMRFLLGRVGLPADALGRYAHQFSGGQRQRLCIARALMLNPDVVVLDEAVSALDVSVQAQVLTLLVELQHEFSLSYLFISHDMAVVERIAHRIAVMYAGQIVEIGDAATVLASPQHSYTRRLISAVPSVTRRRLSFTIDATQVPSLVKPSGYEPPPAQWRQVGPDHKVREEGAA
ncbi:MAG TPA: ABC transporter ATP-binding protein [Devosia sp.]|nr:ABC transporter ATP-binding protein [Devosia sp.]